MAKKVFIDPGHGGDSPGAVYGDRYERDDCLRLALAVKPLVEAQGVEVRCSRTTDSNPSLAARCAEANAWGADYFLSLHRNSFTSAGANGAEAWIWSGCAEGGPTWNKAAVLVDEVCAATGFYDRGVRRGAPSYKDFAVNRDTDMDSCLLECGFISSPADNRIFDGRFDALAEAIARGLCAAVGVSWQTPPAVLYRVQIGAFRSRENAEAYAEAARALGFPAYITSAPA